MAADLFVVPTVTFRPLFVLVILAHDRRQIGPRGSHRASDSGLDGTTTAQRVSRKPAPRYLLHDRNSVFADATTTIAKMIRAIRTAPRSPWQNAYVERASSARADATASIT
jgi:hypothetical protein